MQNLKTGFIGAGNMAQAIIGGLLKTGTLAERITIFDPDEQRAEHLVENLGINAAQDARAIYQNSDVIVLAVKPQVMKAALTEVRGVRLQEGAFIISVAAGIPVAQMQNWLGGDYPIVRVMPNTPALVGAGISGLYATDQVAEAQRQAAESILRAVGSVVWVEDEGLIDSITAVSGSGPAYFFYFIEALEEAALENGLSPDQARLLSLETAFGAARLALESDAGVADLRQRVTSPGGTTEAALKVFADGKLAETVKEAVTAAAERGRELAKVADQDQ